MATEIWDDISSGNRLMPDGTKPSPEPMFTYHHSCPVAFASGQFHKKRARYLWHAFENYYFHICLRHQWVNSIDIYPQQNTIKHEPCIIIFEMHGTMMTTMLNDMGMLSWWTFLVLLPLCLMFPTSICKSSEDLVPVDFVYWWPIFKWIAKFCLRDWAPG